MRAAILLVAGLIALGCAKEKKGSGKTMSPKLEQQAREIPDTVGANAIRAKQPDKSEIYSSALSLEYNDYVDPRQHSQTPTPEQLRAFLAGFGPDFLPLVEEFFFKFPGKLSSTAIRAGTLLMKEFDSTRCKQVAAQSYSRFHGNTPVQSALLISIETCRAESATKDLWKTIQTSPDVNLRLFAQFVLAGFGDQKMKAEIETSLSKDDMGADARSNAISAYLQYIQGTPDGKLVGAFRKFKNQATQLNIAKQLFVTNKEMVSTLQELKKETPHEVVKSELQGQIKRFESMDQAH